MSNFVPFSTVENFIKSHDRDILELQECPIAYTNEIEAELLRGYPEALAFDKNGNRVWPRSVLMAHLQIGECVTWSEPNPQPT